MDGLSLSRSGMTRLAMASSVGTTLEWYDFAVYNIMAALVFNKIFFPSFEPLSGTLLAFSTYAVGYLSRPFGGFVFGHLGAPAMGATGSAVSTVIARWLVMIILAVGTAPVLAQWWVPPSREVLSPRALGRMLAVGLPIGVQVAAEVWVFQLSTVMVGWMGQGLQSGHQIVMSLASLSFMVPLGIGVAAAVRGHG